jgi:hypothetical protein
MVRPFTTKTRRTRRSTKDSNNNRVFFFVYLRVLRAFVVNRATMPAAEQE